MSLPCDQPGPADHTRFDGQALMADTRYCYHCGQHHPETEMRQIQTKGARRWRCIKSIEAAKRGREAREAFGRQTTDTNKAETQDKLKALLNPEWIAE